MEENLRRLTDEIGGRVSGTPQMAKAIEWGVAAFRAAGIDVHTEKYTFPVTGSEGDTRLELLGRLPEALAADGVALLEIGADQGESAPAAVATVLPDWRATVEPDLAGLPRVLRVER